MADTTLTMKLKVQDDGSIVLDKFSGKLAEIPKHVDSMNRSLSLIKWDSIVNLAQKAFHAGERIYEMARSTAFATMEIERMSKISGLSIDAFQKLSYAAKLSDVESESLAKGLKFLSRSMEEASQGSGDASKWFSIMGLSVKDSAGNLKPLDVMMKEVANKFESWEDGPRKIAIALALLGRAGQDMIPLLNEGAAGIQKWASEAEKTGKVLSPDLVTKGAELETQFKKLESSVNVMTKRFILAAIPTKSFGDDIGTLTQKITDFFSKPIVQKYMNFLAGTWSATLIPGVQLLQLPSLLGKKPEEYPPETRFRLPVIAKRQPPALPDEKELALSQKLLEENAKAWGEYADEILNSLEKMQMMKVEEVKKDIAIDSEAEARSLEDDAKAWGVYADTVLDGLEKMQLDKVDEIKRDIAIDSEAEAKSIEDDAKAWGVYADAILESREKLQLWKVEEIKKKIEEEKNIIEQVGKSIGGIWTSHFDAMRHGQESFGEAFKNIWADMADYAISQIERMAANYALFGNIKGENKSGSGLLGWLGGLFGGGGFYAGESFAYQHGGIVPGWKPIEAFQGGGMISQPTLGLIGEGGPEAVIPLKGGKIPIEGGGGQNTYIFISAVDTQSFDQALTKCSGRVVRIVQSNMARNGPLRAR
jgi:hypothetical protein